MTRCPRTARWVFFCGLTSAAAASYSWGQTGTPANPGAAKQTQRPPTADLQVKALPPELEAHLRAWETQSAKVKTLHGTHNRFRYNSVFETEDQAEGHFYFEAPDKGRIDITAVPIEDGQVSKRKNAQGAPYSLTKAREEKWICTGKEVLMVDDKGKTYERFPIPPEMQGKNIIDSPLPFLFGMRADELKKRFDLTLKGQNPAKKTIYLEAIPKQAKDANNFRKADIILNTQVYLPEAVRFVDPAGTIETSYSFNLANMQINSSGINKVVMGLFKGDPFKPDLRGYKLVQLTVSEDLQGKTPNRPSDAPGAVRPTSGTSVAPSKAMTPLPPQKTTVPTPAPTPKPRPATNR